MPIELVNGLDSLHDLRTECNLKGSYIEGEVFPPIGFSDHFKNDRAWCMAELMPQQRSLCTAENMPC
jgi:hypothetical protein